MREPPTIAEPPFVIPDQLLGRCMGQLSLVKKVLRAFINQIQEDLPRLAASIHAGNGSAAALIAHRIKGSAANVAAEPLRASADVIEQLARGSRMQDAQQQFRRLESEWATYRQQTAHFIS